MSDIYELNAEVRPHVGKGECRRIRRLENKVPAIVYGGDKSPEAIVLDHDKLTKALENEAFYSHILTLTVAGKKQKVVLKDLHRHPSRPKILHADFLRIDPKTKFTMHVPLHFINADVSPGVKDQGGIVSHIISEVEVKCLPSDLPEYIEVDLTKMKLDETWHLSDLKLPKNVELTSLAHGKEGDHPVVAIHKPLVSQEAPAEEAAEALTKAGESEGKEA